ncbi:unnamed protein product [Cuscuta europaea]|uniref:Xyloglucan endotransglucosylase/hydrolase n=1 Tax=Cuscuta europaea TaxID=41803 RepID=A0A9P1EB62_CUSEU|nr:unnamed protein product [Cuscuta europaea]
MATFHLRLFFVLCSVSLMVSGSLGNLPIVSFEEGYSHLFGDGNLRVLEDGMSVHLSLDERTGSGFLSHDLYSHGFFSASIKLPSDYTAGVVVAFYMSNADMFEKNHDEIDFEFLGNIRGKDWRVQTNIYGNGSTSRGREERYGLWFDPSEDFHQYTLLWTQKQIVFYVDGVPIREITRTEAMGGDFPSKPMSIYATIWDGSSWATSGGKFKVNYKYAPYTAELSNFVLHGCAVDPIELSSDKCESVSEMPTSITPEKRAQMVNFRRKNVQYSYCYDRARYNVPPPECSLDPKEAEQLRRFDPVRFGGVRRHRGKRHHRHSTRGSRDDGLSSV